MTHFNQEGQFVAGNQYNADKIYLQQKITDYLSESQIIHNRNEIIKRMRQRWIAKVLDGSLKDIEHIHLTLLFSTNGDPWIDLVQEAEHTTFLVSNLLEAYNQSVSSKIVLLGAPGTGKTNTLLEFARDYLIVAENDTTKPIPVYFSLQTWAREKASFDKWITNELHDLYEVSIRVANAWLETGSILLLLDGLDEVPRTVRQSCVQSINTFKRKYGFTPIILTSRLAEYEQIKKSLSIFETITIQLLSLSQVDEILSQQGVIFANIREAIHRDKILQELLTTPLMLNVFIAAYKYTFVDQAMFNGSLEERRRHLFTVYIQRMFERRKKISHSARQVIQKRLKHLAQYMFKHYQSNFYIERIQFDWLSKDSITSAQRWIAILCVFFIVLCIFPVLIYDVLWFGYPLGLLIAVVPILITLFHVIVLVNSLFDGSPIINPVEVVRWSRQKFREGAKAGFLSKGKKWIATSSSIFPFIFGLSGWQGMTPEILRYQLLIMPFVMIGGAFLPVLCIMFLEGLYNGWSGDLLEKNELMTPNQGIHCSLRNGILAVLPSMFMGFANAFLISYFIGVAFKTSWDWQDITMTSIINGATSGMVLGMTFGLQKGLLAFVQHYVLRLFLWKADIMPLNCIHFFDSAVERIFLYQVGGGYRFIHRLLQEHFAGKDFLDQIDSSNPEEEKPVRFSLRKVKGNKKTKRGKS